MGKIRKPKYTPEQFLQHVINNTLVLSYSRLKWLCDGGSPLAFFNNYTQEKNVTPAMELGSIVDMLYLTPNDFKNNYIVKGLDDAAKVKEMQEKDPFKVITKKQYEQALKLANAMKLNIHAEKLKEGEKQKMFSTEIEGVPFKGFLDIYAPQFNRVVDCKTTSKSIQQNSLKWEIKDRGYALQGYLYCKAMQLSELHIIWVNTTSGACGTMDATAMLSEGERLLMQGIAKYKKLQYGAKHIGIDIFKNNTIKPIKL